MDELGCLVWVVWLPYRLWLGMTGESRVGTSPMDRQLGHFWRNFAIVLTIVVVIGALLWVWLTG